MNERERVERRKKKKECACERQAKSLVIISAA